MFENIDRDILSFCEGKITSRKFLLLLFASTDFKAVLYYRISSWFYRRKIKFIAYYIKYLAKKKYSVEISPMANIGPGFRLIHSLGTVIGNKVRIGSDCTIYQQVTLGTAAAQKGKSEYPVIGNSVIIYAGAKVLGGITVGDCAVIAANAVVRSNVEANSVVGGVPARKIR
ncbi:MAG: serine acetyltransferase [Phycisphaerae bacterium]|nr:serine acetyltransferase [Phycisphaerae bacterium]